MGGRGARRVASYERMADLRDGVLALGVGVLHTWHSGRSRHEHGGFLFYSYTRGSSYQYISSMSIFSGPSAPLSLYSKRFGILS